MTPALKAALLYFGIVFGAGFVLGVIRVPLLVPRLGELVAESIELPFMLIVICLTARWVVNRYLVGSAPTIALLVGLLAAALLLAVEFTVVLWLRGLNFQEYLDSRHPVALALYLTSVGIFALMPFLFALLMSRSSD